MGEVEGGEEWLREFAPTVLQKLASGMTEHDAIEWAIAHVSS